MNSITKAATHFSARAVLFPGGGIPLPSPCLVVKAHNHPPPKLQPRCPTNLLTNQSVDYPVGSAENRRRKRPWNPAAVCTPNLQSTTHKQACLSPSQSWPSHSLGTFCFCWQPTPSLPPPPPPPPHRGPLHLHHCPFTSQSYPCLTWLVHSSLTAVYSSKTWQPAAKAPIETRGAA